MHDGPFYVAPADEDLWALDKRTEVPLFDTRGQGGQIPVNSYSEMPYSTAFELMLQPLRLLRNVKEARINLPPSAALDMGTKLRGEDCERPVVSKDPVDDEERACIDWLRAEYPVKQFARDDVQSLWWYGWE